MIINVAQALTLQTIQLNKEKIRKMISLGSQTSMLQASYSQTILKRWKKCWPVSLMAIKYNANALYKEIKQQDGSNKDTVNTSQRWFLYFKVRYRFQNTMKTSKSIHADITSSNYWLATLKNIIKDGRYTAQQVFKPSSLDLCAVHNIFL